MLDIDLSKVAILVDFDGTITTEDTNDKLVKKFWNEEVEEFYDKNEERDMTYIDFMDSLFSKIKISEDQYLDFILNEIQIEDGFIEFYEKAKDLDIPFAIISGGFKNGIIPFLKKYNIANVEVFANELNFDGKDITVDFYHNRDPKCCEIGYCGNCKTIHVDEFREKHGDIIFIGDGITDEPVASKAEVVFAKEGLLKYCDDEGIDCIPWNDFFEIGKIIFKPTT